MKVRFAVSLGSDTVDADHLASLVTSAEERGFDSLWFPDLPLLSSTDPFLAVAFAAGMSKRLKLGVDLVPFGQEPFVFARRVAQLDQLTGGRLLVTLVPGVDLPGERAALGIAGRHRGRLLDSLLPDLRAWWDGASVTVDNGAGPALALPVLPRQRPLEVWLGGFGPEAIRRSGRLADGWLGSAARLTPASAGEICRRIQAEASAAGRQIDPEHFGLSVGYARSNEDLSSPARIPRPDGGAPEPPVGTDGLRSLVGEAIDQGISKFVLRRAAPVTSWHEELDWLARAVLDLQT